MESGHITIPHTPGGSVVSLIRRLHPYSTEKALIRLGPQGDGGYLVPNDLEGIEACFSPGVGNISAFEKDCSNLGLQIFLADRSVDMPELGPNAYQFHFLKKHLGCTNNDNFITMDEWVNSSNLTGTDELLLQMDIEGGEYHTLLNISDALLRRFRILVIEFHNLDSFWNPYFFSLAEAAFDKILQTHTCVHIHPNNCCGIADLFGVQIPRIAEFTFLRNDRINNKNSQTYFPHQLDFDNTGNPHISLPKNWYKSVQQ